jgi:hypothetical protein
VRAIIDFLLQDRNKISCAISNGLYGICFPLIIGVTKSSESTKKIISRGITLHTVVAHFQLWQFVVDLTRATFVIFLPKLSSFID